MADAIVDPGTVMVHLEDAEIALAAVMGSRWLPGLLAQASVTVLKFDELTLERWCHSFRYTARVRNRGSQMWYHCQEAKAIEDSTVEEAQHGQRNALDELVIDEPFVVPVENVAAVPDVLPVKDQCKSEEGKCYTTQVPNTKHYSVESLIWLFNSI